MSAGDRTSRILVVLTVLGLLAAVVGLLLPRVADGGDEESARAEVVSRASDFAMIYNTYDVAQKDDYQQRMKPLLTKDYHAEFTRVTDAVFGALESKDQRSEDAEVLSVAVDTIDDDSAVALVAVDANITTSADEAAVQRRFRWTVTFTRQGGEWLVSEFDSVIPLDATLGEDGEDAEPDADPTPDPEDEE